METIPNTTQGPTDCLQKSCKLESLASYKASLPLKPFCGCCHLAKILLCGSLLPIFPDHPCLSLSPFKTQLSWCFNMDITTYYYVSNHYANAFPPFLFFFFFNFISSLPFVSKGTHAWNSTNISPHMRGEFRHNKRRICKQSAKRVGQENDSAGNSWNTSNFNIWEDWSLEHLSGPGSELHQPFFNVMPGINILIPHTENGFSIKCSFGFYMDSIFCAG